MIRNFGWMAVCVLALTGAACSDDGTASNAKNGFSPDLGGKGDAEALAISEVGRIRPSNNPNSGDRIQSFSGTVHQRIFARAPHARGGQTIEVSVQIEATSTPTLWWKGLPWAPTRSWRLTTTPTGQTVR
ncbi:MAG: hypothetical protein R3E66_09195 [bacterium]